ncbi:Uncharacterized protein YmfQ in lambdoid prophage, DUF2313 family [Faunimonas pinastri]|uniref:Uncharacterized protein YmfQ in lambdoid prophage, DUF2313 family n=1 Tax=Faunimonas pinastri TaxID=1855383 RepID=A0A1H9Q842_9HYPH|nr:putative phage tail protein [Faunimonas pinastri]SER56716.1 Uncharacterized protein YmfQ in lambdoid prophage, DUF2313 family [Faunimonas pinastri]
MTADPRRPGAEYAGALADLLPTGAAWPRDPDTLLMRVTGALSDYWGTVDSRAHDLRDIEGFPDTTTEMLSRWEDVAGLPEECFTDVDQAVEQRRYLLRKKLVEEGGQSRAYFLQLANELGFPDATITEFSPFRAGRSRCGSPIWRVGSQKYRMFWTMHLGAVPVTYFRAGKSRAGRDALARFERATVLECLVGKWKPAHTLVRFTYSLAA